MILLTQIPGNDGLCNVDLSKLLLGRKSENRGVENCLLMVRGESFTAKQPTLGFQFTLQIYVTHFLFLKILLNHKDLKKEPFPVKTTIIVIKKTFCFECTTKKGLLIHQMPAQIQTRATRWILISHSTMEELDSTFKLLRSVLSEAL